MGSVPLRALDTRRSKKRLTGTVRERRSDLPWYWVAGRKDDRESRYWRDAVKVKGYDGRRNRVLRGRECREWEQLIFSLAIYVFIFSFFHYLAVIFFLHLPIISFFPFFFHFILFYFPNLLLPPFLPSFPLSPPLSFHSFLPSLNSLLPPSMPSSLPPFIPSFSSLLSLFLPSLDSLLPQPLPPYFQSFLPSTPLPPSSPQNENKIEGSNDGVGRLNCSHPSLIYTFFKHNGKEKEVK